MILNEITKKQFRKMYKQFCEDKNYECILHYLDGIDNFVNELGDVYFDINDFVLDNIENIEYIQYQNALFTNLKDIREHSDEFVLDFKDSHLIIPKPCVVFSYKYNDIYGIYDFEDGVYGDVICKITLKKQD